MIQKTSKTKGSLYCLTGGHVTYGETPLEAMIREVKEELGINLKDNNSFEVILKYLKYPLEEELNKSYYSVGTLYEINTKFTKDELINIFNNSKHDDEVKKLMFYDENNYKELFLYDNKAEYLEELFNILFN